MTSSGISFGALGSVQPSHRPLNNATHFRTRFSFLHCFSVANCRNHSIHISLTRTVRKETCRVTKAYHSLLHEIMLCVQNCPSFSVWNDCFFLSSTIFIEFFFLLVVGVLPPNWMHENCESFVMNRHTNFHRAYIYYLCILQWRRSLFVDSNYLVTLRALT